MNRPPDAPSNEISDQQRVVLSRREFTSAGLLTGLVIAIELADSGTSWALVGGDNQVSKQKDISATFSPNAWLSFSSDRIRFVVDRVEMGQGVITALTTLIAEELDIAPDRFEIELAGVNKEFGNPQLSGIQLTGGSTSIRVAWQPLRAAGASVRLMFEMAAAKTWGISLDKCRSADGIVHEVDGSRTASFFELIPIAQTLSLPAPPPLKQAKDFKWIGKSVARLESRDKVTGRAMFGIDIKRPGLLYAAIVRPPVIGAKLASYDDSEAKKISGIHKIFVIPAGVAVVAKSSWLALKGAASLKTSWSGGLSSLSSAAIDAECEALANKPGKECRTDGNISKALKGAKRKLTLTYDTPLLAHATLEPQNCTVHIKENECDIWVPTQSPTLARDVAAGMTGFDKEKVRVHQTLLGGGFGRRINQDYVAEAVAVAMQVDAPVQVIWSREDDTKHDFYRPFSKHRVEIAVTEDGAPLAWNHRIMAPSILASVIPEWTSSLLPDWIPNMVGRGLGSLASTLFSGPVADMTSIEGIKQLPYEIPNIRVEYHAINPGVPVGFWRSVGHSQNAFVTESVIDEMAHLAGVDPWTFRRDLLKKDPKRRRVLDLAAEKLGWFDAPPPGIGKGIAVHESFHSLVAQAVEVSVAGGIIKVQRVVCVVDCGPTVNPDIVKAQMEGSIIFGLTAALHGEISLEAGAVKQSNFDDYPLLRMNESPSIEVFIIPNEDSNATPGGIGEPGTPPIAPAVANAVFAATGQRLRKLPLRLPS
jgi:isoquinoline 1-oxidoreductase beta subunit